MSAAADRQRTAGKEARLDRGDFRLPPHGIERFEFHRCRCDDCCAANQRVKASAARLERALHDHPGRLRHGLVAPLDAAHAAELDDLRPVDYLEPPRR